MAYRRRQGIPRESTFKEEIYHARPAAAAAADVLEDSSSSSSTSSSSSSLAARAIRASAAHRDSSAYGYAYATPATDSHSSSPSFLCRDSPVLSASKGSGPFDSTSMKDSDDSKYGFWGILARKAKSILDDENDPQQLGIPNRMKAGATNAPHRELFNQPQSPDSGGKMESPKLRKGLNAITSSLNHIGDTIGNALEEGRVIVENKTAGIIQETRKLQSRRKGPISEFQNQNLNLQNSWQQPGVQPMQKPAQTDQETQLKASRDVAMATAAKAKLLLRELKTTKADLAFAKERCAQLEEENKRLRESKEKGGNTIADDDLIRLQLETLLAEKARLAHENSIYARENRFLREIVEYHQLTMQDLVYFDEGREVVDTVYPFSINDAGVLSNSSTSPTSPESLPDVSPSMHPTEISESTKEISSSDCALDSKELIEAVDFRKESEDHQNNQAASISRVQFPMAKDAKSPTVLSS